MKWNFTGPLTYNQYGDILWQFGHRYLLHSGSIQSLAASQYLTASHICLITDHKNGDISLVIRDWLCISKRWDIGIGINKTPGTGIDKFSRIVTDSFNETEFINLQTTGTVSQFPLCPCGVSMNVQPPTQNYVRLVQPIPISISGPAQTSTWVKYVVDAPVALKNNASRTTCIKCGGPTKEIPLFTSSTRHCPVCE